MEPQQVSLMIAGDLSTRQYAENAALMIFSLIFNTKKMDCLIEYQVKK
jgi:hypothetical protein